MTTTKHRISSKIFVASIVAVIILSLLISPIMAITVTAATSSDASYSDEFKGYASVNTGEDAIYFIRNYCEKYHSFAMNEYLDKANTVYFGTDEENTAYYYFKDSLSVDNLNRIKEQTDEYIVAAPVLYMSQESLEDKNITFLKVDRDVDEAELKVDDEIAKFAMRATYNKKLPLEATMISRNCGSDIEKGISSHFDGMHLCNNFRTTALCR